MPDPRSIPDPKGAAGGALLIRRDLTLGSKEAGTHRGGAGGDFPVNSPRGRPPQQPAHRRTSSRPLMGHGSHGGSHLRMHAAPAVERDVQNEDGGPKTEKGKLFKKLQEQIREGVERADNALLKYEVKDKSMVRLEQAADAARPHSAHQTPLPDKIEHIVPAAEKLAQLRINQNHEDAMRRLVEMYNALHDDNEGVFKEHSVLPDEESVLALLDQVAAHRDEMIAKVESMRKKAIESVVSGPPPIDTESERLMREAQRKEVEGNSTAALKELLELHEKKIFDLENELDEENRVREAMLMEKDAAIAHMKMRMEEQNQDIKALLNKTSHELANSAESVEDTRVHIAYLNLQLRNAKELAASREFDAVRWVLKTDYDELLDEVHRMQLNEKKLQARFVLEHELTQKAYGYAKEVQRAKDLGDEVHAKFELQLRQSLKERDSDLVKLNYESRLLHHRADLMVGEMEQQRIQMTLQVDEEIKKAQAAMEEQRVAFNKILQKRDVKQHETEAKVQEQAILRDEAEAKAQNLALNIQQMQQEERNKKYRMVNQLTQLEFQEILAPLGGKDASSIKSDTGTQTSDVKTSLWEVARRKVAIQVLGLLDRRAEAHKKAECALKGLEAELCKQMEAGQKLIGEKMTKILERESEVLELAVRLRELTKKVKGDMASLHATAEKTKLVTTAMDKCMLKLKPLITASVEQDPTLAEDFLAEDRRKVERALVSVSGPGSSSDINELNFLDTRLTKLATLHKEGGDLGRDLIDILEDSLGGSYAEQLSFARIFIEQESQLRKGDELPVLQATLNLVVADRTRDEAKSMPKIAKDLFLVEEHHKSSILVREIVQHWESKRIRWLDERKRLRMEIDEVARENESGIAKTLISIKDSGSSKASLESGDGSVQNMREELALFRQVYEGLETSMRQVTTAALEWYEEETGNPYVLAQPPNVAGLPTIVGSALSLMQACCLTLLGAVEASNRAEEKTEMVSRNNSPIINPQPLEVAQGVYFKDHEVGLVSNPPTPPPPDPPGESKEELLERVIELNGEIDELKEIGIQKEDFIADLQERLKASDVLEDKFKKERVALRLMRCNIEGMSTSLKNKDQTAKLEAAEGNMTQQMDEVKGIRMMKKKTIKKSSAVTSLAPLATEKSHAEEDHESAVSGYGTIHGNTHGEAKPDTKVWKSHAEEDHESAVSGYGTIDENTHGEAKPDTKVSSIKGEKQNAVALDTSKARGNGAVAEGGDGATVAPLIKSSDKQEEKVRGAVSEGRGGLTVAPVIGASDKQNENVSGATKVVVSSTSGRDKLGAEVSSIKGGMQKNLSQKENMTEEQEENKERNVSMNEGYGVEEIHHEGGQAAEVSESYETEDSADEEAQGQMMPSGGLAAMFKAQNAASAIANMVRRWRDRRSRQMGGADIDVIHLARQAARMRTEFESALLREAERNQMYQKQAAELQTAMNDLQESMKAQEKKYLQQIKDLTPVPIKTKARLIQTDDWEPPMRGVSPTTHAATVEAARLEVRSIWEARLKASEAKLVDLKEEGAREAVEFTNRITKLQEELTESEEETSRLQEENEKSMISFNEKMATIKGTIDKATPADALLKVAKVQVVSLLSKARQLAKDATEIHEMVKTFFSSQSKDAQREQQKVHAILQGAETKQQALVREMQLMADQHKALARKLGSTEFNIELGEFGGKKTKKQRIKAALDGTIDDRPHTGESEVEAAMKLMKLIDEDFEDISVPRKDVARMMCGRSKSPKVPTLLLSELGARPQPPPRAAVSERSTTRTLKLGTLEAWAEGNSKFLPPLPILPPTLPTLPLLPASRSSSRERSPPIKSQRRGGFTAR